MRMTRLLYAHLSHDLLDPDVAILDSLPVAGKLSLWHISAYQSPRNIVSLSLSGVKFLSNSFVARTSCINFIFPQIQGSGLFK